MAVLFIMLSVICLTDHYRTRIPNSMMALLFLYGLGYRYWDAGGNGIAGYLINCVFVFLLLYPLFKIGTVGAGDVKLFSVTAGYLSRQELPCFLIISLLIAAIISIVKICRERCGRERLVYLCSYLVQVCRTGHWKLYFDNEAEMLKTGVCLSFPVLVSILLHIGGVY